MDQQVSHLPSACPDPAPWLAVAAGMENADLSAELTEHASGCAACASQLREAIRIVTDVEDPLEARFLGTLSSSRADWRRRMAQQLSGDRAASRQPPPLRRKIWWNWRLAAVCGAAAVVVVIISLAILRQHRGGLAELAQVSEAPTSNIPRTSPTNAAPGTGRRPLTIAIVLEPGTTRGLVRETPLQLTPMTESVAATLLFLEAPPRRLSVKVVD